VDSPLLYRYLCAVPCCSVTILAFRAAWDVGCGGGLSAILLPFLGSPGLPGVAPFFAPARTWRLPAGRQTWRGNYHHGDAQLPAHRAALRSQKRKPLRAACLPALNRGALLARNNGDGHAARCASTCGSALRRTLPSSHMALAPPAATRCLLNRTCVTGLCLPACYSPAFPTVTVVGISTGVPYLPWAGRSALFVGFLVLEQDGAGVTALAAWQLSSFPRTHGWFAEHTLLSAAAMQSSLLPYLLFYSRSCLSWDAHGSGRGGLSSGLSSFSADEPWHGVCRDMANAVLVSERGDARARRAPRGMRR